jgi:plasmid maintenance system killer protein
MEGSRLGQVAGRPNVDYSVSLNQDWKKKMNFDDQRLDIDPSIIVLGLGYASFLMTAIAWVASL